MAPARPVAEEAFRDEAALAAVAADANGLVVDLAALGIAARQTGLRIDERIHVDLSTADEVSQVLEVPVLQHRAEQMRLAAQDRDDLLGFGAGHPADALDAGGMAATGVDTLVALVVGSMAFAASPRYRRHVGEAALAGYDGCGAA